MAAKIKSTTQTSFEEERLDDSALLDMLMERERLRSHVKRSGVLSKQIKARFGPEMFDGRTVRVGVFTLHLYKADGKHVEFDSTESLRITIRGSAGEETA